MGSMIATWAFNRGLGLIEDILTEAFGRAQPEAQMRLQLDIIEKKLDLIIGAPFKQALMHLREGHRGKGKEKLIEAISLNELDLPAMALYCALLQGEQPALALEYREEMLKKFGYHRDFVPAQLVTWGEQYLREGQPLRRKDRLELFPDDDDPDYYPARVDISPWGIVVLWEWNQRRGLLEDVFGANKQRLIAYTWEGSRQMEIQDRSIAVVAVTGDYVVVSTSKSLAVWSIRSGHAVPNQLSWETCRQLFQTSALNITSPLRWPENQEYEVGALKLRLDRRVYQHKETRRRGGLWLTYGYDDIIVDRFSGKVTIDVSAPLAALG